jgi:prepilin-type N-terminal cleavage/methylation domain-containing protein
MFKKLSKWIKKEQGFTLIETIITLMLFGILSMLVWYLVDYTNKTYHCIDTKADVLEDARVALDFMIFEIRRAEGYQIVMDENNDLLKLKLDMDLNDNKGFTATENAIFTFNKEKRELLYDTVCLAEHIKQITILSKDQNNDKMKDMFEITIECEKQIPRVEKPILFQIVGQVSIQYKKQITK